MILAETVYQSLQTMDIWKIQNIHTGFHFDLGVMSVYSVQEKCDVIFEDETLVL